MDGVLGMALSPLRPDGERYLYFHALAATTENVVSTSLLRNDSFIKNSNAPANSMNVSTQMKNKIKAFTYLVNFETCSYVCIPESKHNPYLDKLQLTLIFVNS